MPKKQPMKGEHAVIRKLEYPLLLSVKLDGIRAVVVDGVVLSNSMKPIPNKYVQAQFGKPEYEGLDGELIVGDSNAEDVYRKTNSAVMSVEGKPAVTFYVFDNINRGDTPYSSWYATTIANPFVRPDIDAPVLVMSQFTVENEQQLLESEAAFLRCGYEGAMVRKPDGVYKFGKSTVNQGYLLKLKRFKDSEAVILECLEQMHNSNEATQDERGRSKRSMSKSGMVPTGTLGKLRVKDLHTGVEFKIGTGFSDEEREEFWVKRNVCVGSLVKYKYFPVGVKDKPRHPVYLGPRSKDDMS